MCVCVFHGDAGQDLKGKILLKAKKIGGLEESFNGMVDDSLTGEFSDEDEVAEIDEDNHHHRESVRRRVKVGERTPQPMIQTGCYPQSAASG